MNDVQRLNLYRHPILQAIYDVMQAIERCGASPELTEAVALASRLSEQAAAILDERDALRAKNKELGGIAHAATDALGRLSFECFGLIEPCERPSVATYNSTYATLVECRKRLADAAIDAALDAARAKEPKA